MSNTEFLHGKAALVTGSTSGIGLAMARALAQAGAKVMLNGLGDADAIEATRADLEAETGREIAYHGADMTKPAEIADAVAQTVTRLGAVDILVNNAGIQHVSRIEDFPEDKWDAIIAINLSSAFHATKAVLPHMRNRGWGRIVNTASAHGLVASACKSAYVAAKHGIVGLTKVTALETAQEPITCNAINPGWVRTELVERQIEAKAQELGCDAEKAAAEILKEKQPSMDFVTPEQLGGTLVFLCSPAADQITGISLPVDGGWTAQ
jgi:3-hydroxybutyrate dehydrogenase